MIYFAQNLDGGPVKIGCSGDVDARIRALEVHYGRPLALLATMPGDREREAEIHEQFGHLRLGRTEQFKPAPELMAFIGRPLLVGSNPDAVEAMESKRIVAVTIKGSEEWKAWLEEAAAFGRVSVSTFLDHAAATHAKELGFPKGPPER